MVLENVDLTGSDRAFMSVDLFRHLGFGALGNSDGQGFIVQDVWDDLAIVEVGSVESGWSVIGCPTQAQLDGACPSGSSIWGGFDGDRAAKAQFGAAPENIVYYGVWQFGTYYGWDNFTEQDLGAFDLSQWAGETVDVRFRFRTGFEGQQLTPTSQDGLEETVSQSMMSRFGSKQHLSSLTLKPNKYKST